MTDLIYTRFVFIAQKKQNDIRYNNDMNIYSCKCWIINEKWIFQKFLTLENNRRKIERFIFWQRLFHILIWKNNENKLIFSSKALDFSAAQCYDGVTKRAEDNGHGIWKFSWKYS